MTISFKYKTVNRPDGTEVKTPSIPVILKWKEQLETVALIDSGADISAMPKAVAEILGCDLSGNVELAYGIGGKVDSIQTKINLSIGKGHEQYEFQIPFKVILGHYDFPILLGRLVLFDKFVISFDQSRDKISLKRVFRQ